MSKDSDSLEQPHALKSVETYATYGMPIGLMGEFVRKHQLAVESLTEQQLAEAIRQAIASGDFMRNVLHDGSKQSVTYIPWREVENIRSLYHELLYAVASKHDGETRHETALRYIREAEIRCVCSESENKSL